MIATARPTTSARNGAWWCAYPGCFASSLSHVGAGPDQLSLLCTHIRRYRGRVLLPWVLPVPSTIGKRQVGWQIEVLQGLLALDGVLAPHQVPSMVAVSGQYLKSICLFLFIIFHLLPSCFPKLQPRLLRKLRGHWIGCGYSISRLGLKRSSWVLPDGDNDSQPRGSLLWRGY